ncbi:transcription elongation factor B polypeptide 3 [Calliphora vicina]|uniref:transcription elongation factor B polypeptide 3 n=1 Tax=Calliphora vicina TaxID=7373 RepID=UPI00325AF045
MTSIVKVIQHYQRSIDSSQDNEARLLHCINKLYKLPIKVEHLQETGVGKTVNSLRKFNGEIGVAAKTLVTKWKAMVAAEEEPMDTTSQTNERENHNDSNGDDAGTTPHDDEEDENHNRNNTSQQLEQSKHRSEDKKDRHKERHKDHSSSSSSNGHKDHSKQSTSSSSHHHNTEKTSSKHSNEKHKSSSSSSKDKESHHKSTSSNLKDNDREKEMTDHKSSRDKHKEREHDKEKERSDKKRDEKSKSDKEHKLELPNNSAQLSHHKSSSHTSSSKSKHEDKHSHSSSKEKERSDKHKSSSKDKERTKNEKSSTHSSSSKDKPEHKSSSTSSTSKSSTKDPDSAERKRRHNSDNDSNDFKSPQPKVAKVHKSSSSTPGQTKTESSPPQEAAEEDVVDDSFDSSMGTNFDDVLGMLNVPVKKGKKSSKSPSTPASSSSTIKKDTTPHRPSTSSSSSSSSFANKVNGTRIAFTSNNPSSSYSTPSTSKASTMKPDLLAPTAKLEPLDPSIALELPTISTNYKPMPLNQTVMDCVFNNSAAASRPARTLTDFEAITHGISSKTMRTKIYSGVRTGQTFQVPSLFDMCIRILQKNIDALEYTGGVPFEVLKPVLERATPHQLYVFEEYNPYLMEDSDVLWQQHVSRNYRTKKRLENESWREMFIRCQEDEERRLSVLKDSIKASQKIAAAPVRKTQLAFVDSMVKPPRNVLKKQEQYGTKAKMVATPAARVASLSSVTPNAARTGDQRLRVAATVRDHAQVSNSSIRNKKAPLMQKTLQFIRGRHKR